ncbi:outer membrane protein [Terriglobus saanensis]|nr:hypothetical protein [Terriglobus saanensis]
MRVEAQAVLQQERPLNIGLGYVGTLSNAPPGTCGCFVLSGGFADVELPLPHRWSAVMELSGGHAGRVAGTSRGLSVVTLLAGPRWRQSSGARWSFYGEGLFGVARGFDAVFQSGTAFNDTATAFAFEAGGGVDLRLRKTVSVRFVRLDYLQSALPNGVDDRQRNLRFGSGVVFHFDTSGLHR